MAVAQCHPLRADAFDAKLGIGTAVPASGAQCRVPQGGQSLGFERTGHRFRIGHDLGPYRPPRRPDRCRPEVCLDRSGCRRELGRHPVVIADRLVQPGRYPGAAEQIAGEVERVGAGHDDLGSPLRMTTHLTQEGGRLGRRVLLARRAGHEATPQGLAPGLEAA